MTREGVQFNNSDIPKEVLKDLNLARLFNGTFINVAEGQFTTRTRVLSLCYDGSRWNFSHRNVTSSYLGIPPTMRLKKFSVTQDTTVKAVHPLYDIKELTDLLLGMTEGSVALSKDQMFMKLKVKVLDDWQGGRLVFTGPFFKFIWRVNLDTYGNRVLSHHGVVKIEAGVKDYTEYLLPSMRLEESTEDIDIEGVYEELNDEQFDVVFEEKDNYFSDPEMFSRWEIIQEGALEEFWEVVEQ